MPAKVEQRKKKKAIGSWGVKPRQEKTKTSSKNSSNGSRRPLEPTKKNPQQVAEGPFTPDGVTEREFKKLPLKGQRGGTGTLL